MLCTGARPPRCVLCGVGADVHCYADAVFLCATCHTQAHCTSSLASHHRLTRVPPEPNHARAEVTARAMGLDPWAVRLRAVAAGRTYVPPPSDVRGRCGAALQLLARRVGLDTGDSRLRAAAAFRTLRSSSPPRCDGSRGVHEPGHALQRMATWAHVPTSFLVAVAAATGRAREVRTATVDVEEDSVDCAIVSPRRIPQELSLFV
ncbi:hypothetical protein VPH35_100288 [Triticum aestivum]